MPSGNVCGQFYCHLYWGCRKIGCKGCLNKFKGQREHATLEEMYVHLSFLVFLWLSFVDMIFDTAVIDRIINNNAYESRILKVCMCTLLCVSLCVRVCVCVCVCACVCMHACIMCMRVCVCMYVCMYIIYIEMWSLFHPQSYLTTEGYTCQDMLQFCLVKLDSGEYHCSGLYYHTLQPMGSTLRTNLSLNFLQLLHVSVLC